MWVQLLPSAFLAWWNWADGSHLPPDQGHSAHLETRGFFYPTGLLDWSAPPPLGQTSRGLATHQPPCPPTSPGCPQALAILFPKLPHLLSKADRFEVSSLQGKLLLEVHSQLQVFGFLFELKDQTLRARATFVPIGESQSPAGCTAGSSDKMWSGSKTLCGTLDFLLFQSILLREWAYPVELRSYL